MKAGDPLSVGPVCCCASPRGNNSLHWKGGHTERNKTIRVTQHEIRSTGKTRKLRPSSDCVYESPHAIKLIFEIKY